MDILCMDELGEDMTRYDMAYWRERKKKSS